MGFRNFYGWKCLGPKAVEVEKMKFKRVHLPGLAMVSVLSVYSC